MSIPSILAIATGVPEFRYTQTEIFEYMKPLFERVRHARSIFKRAGVDFRHMVVNRDFYHHEQGTQARNELYLAEALPLGEATIRRCLEAAGVGPEAVDDFFVVSCTGFDIPGLDLHLASRLGMRHDLRRTCVLGMGCYAAFPGLLRARRGGCQPPGPHRTGISARASAPCICSRTTASRTWSARPWFSDGASAALIRSPEES